MLLKSFYSAEGEGGTVINKVKGVELAKNSADIDADDEDEDTQKDRYLTFRLQDEDYGIEIRHVIEIVGMQHIAVVPDMPEFIKGVINLRGQVIPVMDVRSRFKMETRDYDERTCIIVIKITEALVGLVVDTVKEVVTIPEDSVTPPPRVARTESTRYIKGIGKLGDEVKILIDSDKLLFENEQQILGDVVVPGV